MLFEKPLHVYIFALYFRTFLFYSDVGKLQEKIDNLESQSHSTNAKEVQLQAELSAAHSEVKQLQGEVSDADMYNKRCQELQSKANCK